MTDPNRKRWEIAALEDLDQFRKRNNHATTPLEDTAFNDGFLTACELFAPRIVTFPSNDYARLYELGWRAMGKSQRDPLVLMYPPAPAPPGGDHE